MKLTNFTREKSRRGNFNFLEFGKGKAYMLPLLMLSLVLFSTNTATAGGFFEKMFKKAEKVLVVQPLAKSGVVFTAPFMAPNDGFADTITDVCACDDGSGMVTFQVTIDEWPDGTDPLLPSPYNVSIFYTSDPPPNELGLTAVNIPSDPGGGPVTIEFGPVSNAMVPTGDVELSVITPVDPMFPGTFPINTADFPYTINDPLALTCNADTTVSACSTQASINAEFAAWLTGTTASDGCNVVLGNDATVAPDSCGGAAIVTWTATDDCGSNETCSATFTVTAAPAVSLTCPVAGKHGLLPDTGRCRCGLCCLVGHC